MRHKYRNTALILSLALVSACTAIEKSPYPADWPHVDLSVTDCAGLNGVYSSAAALLTYRHPHQDVLLASALLPSGEYLTQVERVSLDYGSDGYLVVNALAEDDTILLTGRYRDDGEFLLCESGVLIFNPSQMPGRASAPDNPLVGISKSRIELQRTQDGSLIVRESGSATGMAFLLVPMHMQSEEWYLFRLWRSDN